MSAANAVGIVTPIAVCRAGGVLLGSDGATVSAGGAAMLIVMVPGGPLRPTESVTLMFTLLKTPADVGVPVIEAPFWLKPAGRPFTVKVYGAVPPVADKGRLTATPSAPEKSPELIRSGSMIVML